MEAAVMGQDVLLTEPLHPTKLFAGLESPLQLPSKNSTLSASKKLKSVEQESTMKSQGLALGLGFLERFPWRSLEPISGTE